MRIQQYDFKILFNKPNIFQYLNKKYSLWQNAI